MREDEKTRLLREAAVMQAYANGEEVQYQSRIGRDAHWFMFGGNYFNFAQFDYRIKPAVKKSVGYRRYLRVFDNAEYVYIYHEGNPLTFAAIEDITGFIRWIDTEWQYEIV